MTGPLNHPSPAQRDARIRARCIDRLRHTPFGADHPAIEGAVRWVEMMTSVNTVAASTSDLMPFLAQPPNRGWGRKGGTRSAGGTGAGGGDGTLTCTGDYFGDIAAGALTPPEVEAWLKALARSGACGCRREDLFGASAAA